MSTQLMPFLWLIITLPVLLLSQRWIHRHLHGLAFLLTGNKNWAVVLYAIILLPGVFLHEISHWITAQLLGVRTGAFSILPKIKPDGAIQLGYVEYYKTQDVGAIRESLIGSAPLVTGTAAILLVASQVFEISSVGLALQTGDVEVLTLALTNLLATGDFLVWLYLIFAISNAMMPSASDRRAWPAFVIILLAFAAILYLVGLEDVLLLGLVGPVATIFGYLALAFSLTIGVNLFFMFIIVCLEWLFSRIKGVDLVYSRVETPPGES